MCVCKHLANNQILNIAGEMSIQPLGIDLFTSGAALIISNAQSTFASRLTIINTTASCVSIGGANSSLTSSTLARCGIIKGRGFQPKGVHAYDGAYVWNVSVSGTGYSGLEMRWHIDEGVVFDGNYVQDTLLTMSNAHD